MLKRLVVNNFRSIQNAELKLGRLNMFIGGNGSGKSNLLEAVAMISACLERGLGSNELDERGVRLSNAAMFKSSFSGRKRSNAFRLTGTFDTADPSPRELEYAVSVQSGDARDQLTFRHERLEEDGERVFGRGPRGIKLQRLVSEDLEAGLQETLNSIDPTRSLWDVAGPLLRVAPESRALLRSFSRFAIFSPQTAVMRGVVRDVRAVRPLGLTGTGLASAWLDLLVHYRRTAHPELKPLLDLAFLPGWTNRVIARARDPAIVPDHMLAEDGKLLYFQDRYMQRNRNLLSPFDASEGSLYCCFVAALMGHRNTPQMFALDNVDSTLNPGIVRKLVTQIAETVCLPESDLGLPRQVFLTTHNPTALDAVDLFNDQHHLFIVSRDKKTGATKFRRLKPPPGIEREAWGATKAGRSLSTLWIEKHLPEALG